MQCLIIGQRCLNSPNLRKCSHPSRRPKLFMMFAAHGSFHNFVVVPYVVSCRRLRVQNLVRQMSSGLRASIAREPAGLKVWVEELKRGQISARLSCRLQVSTQDLLLHVHAHFPLNDCAFFVAKYPEMVPSLDSEVRLPSGRMRQVASSQLSLKS